MQGLREIRGAAGGRAAAAALAAAALAAAVPVGLAASAPPDLRAEAARLHATADGVALELYALETQLARAQTQLNALASRRLTVEAERRATRAQITEAGRAAHHAQLRLRELVRALYVRGQPDPLAVVLGSESLDEALTGLESLDRSAEHAVQIGDRVTAARERLSRLEGRLRARTAELAAVEAGARARASELRSRATERAAYLTEVRARAALTERELARAQERARAAQRQAQAVQAATVPASPEAAPAAPVADEPPPALAEEETAAAVAPTASGTRTLQVVAVAYSLPGTTATGLPVGHGIVAVDPSVIPLGTRLYVPGYGDAVAADTGSGVRGAMIDVWLPTLAQARAWGRRTLVVTLR